MNLFNSFFSALLQRECFYLVKIILRVCTERINIFPVVYRSDIGDSRDGTGRNM